MGLALGCKTEMDSWSRYSFLGASSMKPIDINTFNTSGTPVLTPHVLTVISTICGNTLQYTFVQAITE